MAIEIQPDGNTLLLSEEKLNEMNTSWVDSTVGTINILWITVVSMVGRGMCK